MTLIDHDDEKITKAIKFGGDSNRTAILLTMMEDDKQLVVKEFCYQHLRDPHEVLLIKDQRRPLPLDLLKALEE